MQKPRVILFVGGSLMPFCRFRRAMIKRLVDHHGSKVICAYWGDRQDGVFRRFDMPGVTWVDLGGAHASNPGARDLVVLWRLYRLVRRVQPDIACCFNAKPIALAPRVIKAARRKARVVVLMEGLGSALAFLLQSKTTIKHQIFKYLTRPVGQWIVLNCRDADVLARVHPDRKGQFVVLRGIGTDIRNFLPPSDALRARRLIFVGRLTPQKGVGFFLELVRYLRASGRTWHAAIAGIPAPDGEIYTSEVRAMIAKGHLESCGPVDDMPAFYRNASILIFPSVYEEGLPAAIMEAQASGLPCLVLDRPAIRGAILDGETGFVLPDLNLERWAECLDRVSDPAIFAALSAAARRHACATYDDRRTNARIASVLLQS